MMIKQAIARSLAFARDDRSGNEKAESSFSIRLFKKLPRRCRLGGSPVPFGNGRMTVARASDFQLRRAMFPKTRPSLLGSEVSVRESHLYLEQRRVKH